MLFPNKVKYRKQFQGKINKKTDYASKGNLIKYGKFGLKSLEIGYITSRQLEAARKSIMRSVKRKAKLWINIYPHRPVTKKPEQVRMGSGKGYLSHWVQLVNRGNILFEIYPKNKKRALRGLELAADKLPIKTKLIKKC